jgi:hypothetical protein
MGSLISTTGTLLGEALPRKFERDSEDLWEKRFLWVTTGS